MISICKDCGKGKPSVFIFQHTVLLHQHTTRKSLLCRSWPHEPTDNGPQQQEAPPSSQGKLLLSEGAKSIIAT